MAIKRIVAFGDSITQGWDGNRGVTPWTAEVSKQLSVPVDNQAVGGSTMSGDNRDHNFVQQVQNTNLSGYDVATIAFGTNDFAYYNSSLSAIKSALTNGIDTIKSKNPHIKMIGILPIQTWKGATNLDTRNGAGYSQNDLLAAERSIYQQYGIAVLDWRDAPLVTAANHSWTLGDEIVHPTAETYVKMGDRIAKFIKDNTAIPPAPAHKPAPQQDIKPITATGQFMFEIYMDIYTDSGVLHYVHNADRNFSLDIEFSLPFDNTSDRSVGEITIWNMSQISFNRIHEGNRVVVNAGYHGDTGIIFDGQIYKTTVPTREGGDLNYTLRVVEGTDYRNLKHVSLTFGEGTDATTIINKIVQVSGINLNFVSLGRNYVFKEGYTVDGSPFDALSDVADQTRSALFYRRGQLTLRWLYDAEVTGNFMLDSKSGLISSPTMERRDDDWIESDDDDGQGRYEYSADSILNYRITTGEHVHLVSEFVDVWAAVLSGEHTFDGTNPTTTLELGVK